MAFNIEEYRARKEMAVFHQFEEVKRSGGNPIPPTKKATYKWLEEYPEELHAYAYEALATMAYYKKLGTKVTKLMERIEDITQHVTVNYGERSGSTGSTHGLDNLIAKKEGLVAELYKLSNEAAALWRVILKDERIPIPIWQILVHLLDDRGDDRSTKRRKVAIFCMKNKITLPMESCGYFHNGNSQKGIVATNEE